jgi:exonuclease SbcD
LRILHTADWHLGRIFHGYHLTTDQEHLLEQLHRMLADKQPDVLIVAGDLYDRAQPPADAIALLDRTLIKLAEDFGRPVFLIAGNHDNPERVAFASSFLRRAGIHVVSRFDPDREPDLVEDAHGPVAFHLIPFLDPPLVAQAVGEETVRTQQQAMEAAVARSLAHVAGVKRHVLVGHGTVTGGRGSDSERPIAIGGAEQIDARVFDPFCYTALGHLHEPQQMLGGRVRYAGSLMKYSTSEIEHTKGSWLIDIDAEGAIVGEEFLPWKPLRDLVRYEGTIAQLLSRDPCEDYVVARLTDPGIVMDPVGRLRDRFPNIVAVERPDSDGAATLAPGRSDVKGLADDVLFANFFKVATGEEPTPEQIAFFVEQVAAVRTAQRQGGEND